MTDVRLLEKVATTLRCVKAGVDPKKFDLYADIRICDLILEKEGYSDLVQQAAERAQWIIDDERHN